MKLAKQIGREHGEKIDDGYYSHRIERKEFARRIRDHPDLDYVEPRELAEFLHSIDNLLDISEKNRYYRICRGEEERE